MCVRTATYQESASAATLQTTAPAESQRGVKDKKLADGNVKEIEEEGWEYENQTHVDTRRVLYGRKVAIGKRPYMVSFSSCFYTAEAFSP